MGVVSRLNRLTELRHEHISPITEVLEDQTNVYILSDCRPGGDVADWLQRMDENNWVQEQTCASYVRQVVLALVYCHNMKVMHGDLNPNNMLLTSKLPDAKVLVGDFGLAALLDPEGVMVRKHASAFVAPEVMMNQEPAYGGAADLWSVGAIAHTLLLGRAPNDALGSMNSRWRVDARRVHDDEDGWSDRSNLSRDFVMRLLRPSGERPTAAKALQHPWLKSLLPIGGVHLRDGSDTSREARHKTLCYTLAVLLVPVLVPHVTSISCARPSAGVTVTVTGLSASRLSRSCCSAAVSSRKP